MELFGSSAICYRYDVCLALCLLWTVSCEKQGLSTEMNGDNLYGCKLQHQSSAKNLHWTRIYLGKGFKCHCIKLGFPLLLSYLFGEIYIYVHICTQNIFSIFFWQNIFRCLFRFLYSRKRVLSAISRQRSYLES